MAARANRSALIVASVPEFTNLTISTASQALRTSSANSVSASVGAPNEQPAWASRHTASTTSGCAWPQMSGPHEPT